MLEVAGAVRMPPALGPPQSLNRPITEVLDGFCQVYRFSRTGCSPGSVRFGQRYPQNSGSAPMPLAAIEEPRGSSVILRSHDPIRSAASVLSAIAIFRNRLVADVRFFYRHMLTIARVSTASPSPGLSDSLAQCVHTSTTPQNGQFDLDTRADLSIIKERVFIFDFISNPRRPH
jgi:hypothetical protein